MENQRLFFKRLSSVKVEYENEKRRTLLSSNSNVQFTFSQPKEEIWRRLDQTLSQDNVEELYVEILCLLFPTLESRQRPDSAPLLRFLQNIFNLDPSAHKTLMERAIRKKVGGRVLYLEVVEAKNLPAKDLNGLSDPFCTLYVTTKDRAQRTRVVEKSLNPIWNEYFKFQVTDPQKDFLRIDVWDQDPEERMRDKLRRVIEIKSPRSMNTFMREVTHGRKSTQEYIGKLEIPMREVSSETTEKWMPLVEGKGEVYLRMTLGVEKDRQFSVGDYRAALQVLVIHELKKTDPMVPFNWEYKFEPWGDYLLRQLRNGWGLKLKDVLLAKWLAVVRIHSVFSVNGSLIQSLASDLFLSTRKSDYNAQEVSLMWKLAEEFLDFSATFVESCHQFFPCTVTCSQLYHILRTLETLGKSLEGMANKSDTRTTLTPDLIRRKIEDAVAIGALNYFKYLLKEYVGESSNPTPVDIQAEKIFKLGQLLNEDLKMGEEAVDQDLKEILHIDYHLITYKIYDSEYGKLVKPLVSKFCDSLKQMSQSQGFLISEGERKDCPPSNKSQSPGSNFAIKFFHLYLSLKQFTMYSRGEGWWTISGSFHKWFYPGVNDLLDIFGLMWVKWMERAVENDYGLDPNENDLIFYKSNYKITSSAFDSAQIIISAIQGFWVSLSWPDPEQSLLIVDKILKELCGYSISYAKLVSHSLEEFEKKTIKGLPYKVSAKLCRSINNIDHVGAYCREVTGQLNVQEVLSEFPQGEMTEYSLLNKQLEIQLSGQIGVVQEILYSMASKMGSKMTELLRGVVDNDEAWGNKMNKEVSACLEYYRMNFEVIGVNLILDYYEEAVKAIWDQTLISLTQILNEGLKKEKGWKYFSKLADVVDMLKGFLETELLHHPFPSKGQKFTSNPRLRDLCKKLDKCRVSTSTLKRQYYQRRMEQTKGELGIISIRTFYQKTREVLVVEILNARNIRSSDSNGLSDPYVEVVVVPSEDFLECPRQTTKVVKGSLYPLFDETLSIGMREDAFHTEGYIRFTLFDYDFLRKDDFLGEAFYPLGEVALSEVDRKVEEFPQRFLPLSDPLEADISFLESLAGMRTTDKELQAFLKRQKEKRINSW